MAPAVHVFSTSDTISMEIPEMWLMAAACSVVMLVAGLAVGLGYFQPLSFMAMTTSDSVSTEREEKVVHEMRLKLRSGDHHAAYKLWQRIKSFDVSTSVSLVDVVRLLSSLGKSHAEVVRELRSALECNESLGADANELLDDLLCRGQVDLHDQVVSVLEDQGVFSISKEELVSRQLRLHLSAGDYHAAFKLWQRVKSFDTPTSVTLVDALHVMRGLGKSHIETVSEFRSALDCNASLGSGAFELLDDLRRRKLIGLLGKVVALFNEKGIKCSMTPEKARCSSDDDDVSTQLESSDRSTTSDSSDDESEASFTGKDPKSPRLPQEPDVNVIAMATFLRLRPQRGPAPAGYLHAATVKKAESYNSSDQQPATNKRWECLRPESEETTWRSVAPEVKVLSDTVLKIDSAAPWRKKLQKTEASTCPDGSGAATFSSALLSSKPGSLTSGLVGGPGLRPMRRL